jgi:hypothetical protein
MIMAVYETKIAKNVNVIRTVHETYMYSVQHTAHSIHKALTILRNVCPQLQNNVCALREFDAPNTLLL